MPTQTHPSPSKGVIFLAIVLMASGAATLRRCIRRRDVPGIIYGAVALAGGLAIAAMYMAFKFAWW